VVVCGTCGRENPEDARFCNACAEPLGKQATSRPEIRKTVTIVFCDVTGSTAFGELIDPETLRKVMTRYFETARVALQRHGGTVEKFIGDAVVAIFGIPLVHEDDALRAVRGVAELRDSIGVLNKELERDHGMAIETRIGVHTGEVMAGDVTSGHAMMSGDPGNVAARLEQACAPDETLLSDATYRLVRDAVTVDSVGPLELKGKAKPVETFRLLAVLPGVAGHVRRLDSALVGRAHELALLQQAFEGIIAQRVCHLFTLLGPPGVGKSRLVHEFIGGLTSMAKVLRGRCLPYGEGITFWPLVEAVHEAADFSSLDPPETCVSKIQALLPDTADSEAVAGRVAQLVGAGEPTVAAIEEAYWGVRKLFEAMARKEPLVLVLDDLQWAEPAFIDLVDNLADWSRDAPILLLVQARPELLDLHPGWGGGKAHCTTVSLDALSPEECRTLMENFLRTSELDPAARERIIDRAEGNPLFVEETLGMLIDEGLLQREDGRWLPVADLSGFAVPPTIQALLAARLDRLPEQERAILGRAAVVGKVFYGGALRALSPATQPDEVDRHLMALVRRDLVRPDRSDLPGEEAYRFHHLLLRDAAYQMLPKETRAELHERFANWLGVDGADEFVGHHLEQAHRLRAELGQTDEATRILARRAAAHLAVAGRRAKARLDVRAAANLLRRAAALLPDEEPERPEILIDLGVILLFSLGEPREADRLLSEAIDLAKAIGHERLETYARLERARAQLQLDPKGKIEGALAEAERLIPAFAERADARGLAAAHGLRMDVYWFQMRYDLGRLDALEAAKQARAAGDRRRELGSLTGVLRATLLGSTPADEALREVERIRGELIESRWFEPTATALLAGALTLLGRFAEARDLLERADALSRELNGFDAAPEAEFAYWLEMVAGDFDAAERHMRRQYEVQARAGDVGHLSTTAGYLAQACYALGRYDESDRLAEECERLSAPEDVINQWLWRGVRAKILARHGEFQEAELLAREAVEWMEPTDAISLIGDAYRDLAEVLTLAGETEGAKESLRRALELYERKGNLPASERTQKEIAALEGV
jgi:class 3 adenylate cyclase/tetratricopeptide (TPR) repeat protein